MSNHLYWRLYITEGFGSGSTAGYYTIGDIQMRATVGGADQCEGGTASASNEYSSTYAASKAFDTTNQSTWWATFTTTATQWIKYAFASAVDVVEVVITSRTGTNYSPKSFKLQWSDDDTNWTDAGGSWSGLSWTVAETKVFTFPDVSGPHSPPLYRYWRLNITASAAQPSGKAWYQTIAEMEMRATIGGADQCSGGTPAAFSYVSGYDAGKAVDNSTSTYWYAAPTTDPGAPYWISYDFANAVGVAEVAITRYNTSSWDYSPKTFSLEGSNNNSTWDSVPGMSWSNVSFSVGETKTFHAIVYAKAQAKLPYGLGVEVYSASPYSTLVTAAQNHLFDMPPLIVKNQVATPFGITMATGQRHLFDMPPLLVSSQVAMPFDTLLAVGVGQPYACADLILQFAYNYDMTTRVATSLTQPFGVAITKGVASPYAVAVATSLTTGYTWTVEQSLEQPYANPLVVGGRQPYSLTLAVQNNQSFAILFATNSCEQPCPIQLEAYHVQPWQVPVAQVNTQPLYNTVCTARCQPWSILWPVEQANGQSFDRTITVSTSLCHPHDLLAHNPVAKSLTGSWDLSTNRPSLRLDGGVRAFHFGVSL